ncbi:MAG: hypothetical protein WAO55_03560 [Candidatus Manganitrophaceae bacterium]
MVLREDLMREDLKGLNRRLVTAFQEVNDEVEPKDIIMNLANKVNFFLVEQARRVESSPPLTKNDAECAGWGRRWLTFQTDRLYSKSCFWTFSDSKNKRPIEWAALSERLFLRDLHHRF